ncbi:penicillin-binding transpeptidase domain-containing protein [Streptomyces sp. NPDC059740]|uniref:penicillin-binding transpeptidase domain-containing protein n=1 Tax=Streptomyces sp. NPDC059740 TaxID=3346926 RepID=UPI003647A12B
MRREVRNGVVAGAAGLVVLAGAGVGIGAWMAHSGDQRQQVQAGDDAKPSPSVKTGPPSATEVRTTAQRFLKAWSAQDVKAAAALTDDEKAAGTALTAYRTTAHISHVTLTPTAPTGAKVPFQVSGRIEYKGLTSPVSYATALTVVRDTTTGKPVVDWKPSVIHPDLGEGDQLRTGEADAPPIKAVDRAGRELTAAQHPALSGVLAALRERYGDKTDGKPGVEFFVDRAKARGGAKQQPDKTLKTLSQGTPGTLHTTLDATMQSAAEKAVATRDHASLVALKPSTGEVLAIANSPAGGFDSATQGSLAPGSTMKIVTSALLMDKGLTSPEKEHPCPQYFTYGGWKFQNLDKSKIDHGTFAQSFAASCNNAFIKMAPKLENSDLTQEARDYFGIGLNWQTGIPSFDGSVPVQSDAQMAASLIGQGGVRMNPLNVASLAATVRTGGFHQPYLVAPSVDHRTLARAPKTLNASTASKLKYLMRLTATSGTGAEAMAGLSGDIGAKTGSAEVDNQKKPNAWFTAYRDDVAAAAVVPASGHGGTNAGPLVRAVLTAG